MKAGAVFWAEHVAAIKREGVSASAYARQHGLSVAAVYYWQRKFRVGKRSTNHNLSNIHKFRHPFNLIKREAQA
jgi:hypothetical protein